MSKLGSYCKAVPLARLHAYPGWSAAARLESIAVGDAQPTIASGPDAFLYLQDDYTVTTGIFLSEDVVFDAVTPEWRDYCRDQLHFDPDHID